MTVEASSIQKPVSQFPYSFSGDDEKPMDLAKYLARCAATGQVRIEPAQWELGDHLACGPAPRHGPLTADNFSYVIPSTVPIEEAGLHLCGKLVVFAIGFLERVCEAYVRENSGRVPTAEQLMMEVDGIGATHLRDPAAEVWMYQEATKHPVVMAAVTSAFNDRWNRKVPFREFYDRFSAPEFKPVAAVGTGAKASPRRTTRVKLRGA